jgi:hypothetical protein
MEKRPQRSGPCGQREMPAINPDLLPRCRFPVLPGQPGHAVRQGNSRKRRIVIIRCDGGRAALPAKKPILFQWDRADGGAAGRSREAPAPQNGNRRQRHCAESAASSELPARDRVRLVRGLGHYAEQSCSYLPDHSLTFPTRSKPRLDALRGGALSGECGVRSAE